MKRTMNTVPDLLKDYQPDPSATHATRVADMLTFVAEKMPGSFVTRRDTARVAFALARIPQDGSDYLGKKLGVVIACAKAILLRRSNDWIVSDRFLGVRATFSDFDKSQHPLEDSRRRLEFGIRKVQKVISTIDPKNLPPDARKRFNTIARYQSILEDYQTKVPILTQADPKKKTDDEK